MNKNLENMLCEILKGAGYKVTKPRLLVLSILYNSKKPLRVKDIVSALPNRSLDTVTVYRVLEVLKTSNIIHQIDLRENATYFEFKDSKDHHHIICVACKKIKNFTGCVYKKISKEALKQVPDFTKITNHSFELFGICNTCIK